MRGTLPSKLTLKKELHGDASIDSIMPESDRLSSLKRQYETLLNSILADHKSYLSRIRLEQETTTAKMEGLISRCAKLETAVTEGTKELLKERKEKHGPQL